MVESSSGQMVKKKNSEGMDDRYAWKRDEGRKVRRSGIKGREHGAKGRELEKQKVRSFEGQNVEL
jgi:hypothetical protein